MWKITRFYPLPPSRCGKFHIFFFFFFLNPSLSYTRIYFILRSNGAAFIRRNIEATNTFTNKRMMKALKMSIVHCALFVFSWTPYTVMATWYVVGSLYLF